MTEEEKSLLSKDLCARQPYSVMINTPLFEKPTLLKGIADNMCWAVVDEDNYEWVDINDVKPYLRPLSSISDKEKGELFKLCEYYEQEDWERKITEVYGIEIASRFSLSYDTDFKLWNVDMRPIDWLNQHHFDYRNLIKKGLALEAPKDMYI